MRRLTPDLNDLLELRHQAHSLGLASRHQVNSVLCGLYQSVFRGQGMDFEEVREYREGDEIRNMDWRVTARTGIPHLKVFREERQRTVMVCLDIGNHMNFGTRGTFKSIQAARTGALLGWAASASQDRVGAILYGDPAGLKLFSPCRSKRELWRILNAMTNTAYKPTPNGQALFEAMEKMIRGSVTGSLIAVIGDFNVELAYFEQLLGRLRQRHEIVLFPIEDAADKEIPAMGRVVFAQSDGTQLELDTDNAAGRLRYQQEWETKRRRLDVICRRLKVDIIPIATHVDVHHALTLGLRKRAIRVVSR